MAVARCRIFLIKKTDYKVGSDLPEVDETWGTFSDDDIFSGYDEHAWFYKKVVIPAHLKNKNIYLHFSTNVYGWDAVNPQFIVYINGKIVQALDVNHTMVKLDSSLRKNGKWTSLYQQPLFLRARGQVFAS